MVISNHLQMETRFRTPKLLSDHGIKRAILIARGGEGHLPFGVLEVDSPDPGQFDFADADFLAGFAGLLGIAIERQHADADLRDALEHQAMLTREMSHRVKNSLASVVGLLRVQSRSAESDEDKAIPLGLLINEIVTNSAKHAYPGHSGEIQVSANGAAPACMWKCQIKGSVFRRISISTNPGRAWASR